MDDMMGLGYSDEQREKMANETNGNNSRLSSRLCVEKIKETDTEDKQCDECGGEDLVYMEQYACGEHYKCKGCGKEICFMHETNT